MSDTSMSGGSNPEVKRRDFLYVATGAVATVGAAASLWPFIDALNPTKDVLALSVTDVDLEPIEVGQRVTVMWQKKPVFIVRRTEQQIAEAKADDNNPDLIDPATDAERVANPEWLVVIGICTHLGCIPKGQKLGDPVGKWGGWFCVCHGSVYDMAGRVRVGPAPLNLVLPPYQFLDNGRLQLG